jgi:DNA-binding Xre family transcriptional regulator
LASLSGLATFTVSRMESTTDPAQVRVTTLHKICRTLGVSLGEFFAHLDNTDADRERRKMITQIARRLEKEDAETIGAVQGVVQTALELRHKRK